MYWDRFDIVEAYYLYFCHHHEGQGSLKYQRLSFKDGQLFHTAAKS